MSFYLIVVSIDADASDEAVRAMVKRCQGDAHPEGELDERVVGFYEDLRSRYPDASLSDADSPWMSTPLDIGIDHVSMCMTFGEQSTPAIRLIDALAQRHGLTIYDPQGDEVTRPTDVRVPLNPALVTLIDSLRSPDG